MATIKDIAKLSGFSIGTVSRVINNRADVSPATREIIERVIREQNFQPNTNAKRLKQTMFSPVTIIVKGIGNTFLEAVLEEIQINMYLHGESINVTFLDERANCVAEAVKIIAAQNPKGLIFLGGSINNFRKDFKAVQVPSVLVTGNASMLGYDNLSSFTTDDYRATADAVEHLVRAGHRRIGILGGYPESWPEDVGALRLSGAVNALESGHADFVKDRDYEPCAFSLQGGYNAARNLLRRTPDLTALFAIGDLVAVGALKGLQDNGYRVPQDISVIGFDGIPFAGYTNPRLATIKQDISLLAKRTVEDLLLRMNYQRPVLHETIPYYFVEGESIAVRHSSV